MKYIVFLSSLLILALSSCSIRIMERKGVYQEINAEQFSADLLENGINLIDVRTPGEYQKSHIKGAWNVSYLGGSYRKKLDTLSLDKTKPTYIYCETQHRSLFAAKQLYKAGFIMIIDLDKGMMQYRKEGFPYIISDTIK